MMLLSPVPSTLEKSLITTKLSLKSLINEIKNYEGVSEELKKLNEVGRLKIAQLREIIDKLETEYRELNDEDDMRTHLQNLIKNEKEQLLCTIKDFQKANVHSMLAIERRNHEELFAMSNPDEVLKHRKTRNQSTLLQQNSEITDHLSSVSRQLAEVLNHNSSALENLVKGSTSIAGIRDELKNTGSIIDQSGKLLNKYEQREFSDKLLISAAFIFFLICVAYVIYSRI